MNQYQKLKLQFQQQSNNIQSRIDLYQKQPVSLNTGISYYVPEHIPQIKMNRDSVSYDTSMNLGHVNNVSHQSYSPSYTEPMQKRYTDSPTNGAKNQYRIRNGNGSQQIKIKILPELNLDNSHHLKMRMAEAEAIRLQQESNRIRKNKEKQDMFFENSVIIQNQVNHYPYGNIHSNIMQKIINRKLVEDKNNENVLSRFQQEAEEFKKSKSKYIKNMLLESKQRQQLERQRQRIQQQQYNNSKINSPNINRSRRLNNQVAQSPFKQNKSKVFLEPIKQEQLNRSSYFQNYQSDSVFTPRTPAKNLLAPISQNSPNSPIQSIKVSSPIRVSTKTNKKPKYHLYPLTNQGQDGLKIIKRNLRLKSLQDEAEQQDQESQKQRQIDQYKNGANKQIESLQESIKELSCMIKNNRQNMSLDSHGRKQKQDDQKQNRSRKKSLSKFNKEYKQQNSIVDPLKMRKYYERLEKNGDSELKNNRQYLDYLSSVVN